VLSVTSVTLMHGAAASHCANPESSTVERSPLHSSTGQ
jgi:hypothetical protein